VLEQLGASAAESIFVGDDPRCDIAGARLAGMKTIRVCRGVHARLAAAQGCDADARVASISEVPSSVSALANRDMKEVGHAA
jgi:FMN phosphatase YigB (HAD superfamily)